MLDEAFERHCTFDDYPEINYVDLMQKMQNYRYDLDLTSKHFVS